MTLVISHRGLGFGAPEHSLQGYKSALEAGVDAVEVDVHLSRDGQLVCIHDSSLSRTAGVASRVDNQTHQRLYEFGVVPLWQVLALLKDMGGQKGVFIETKHPVVSGSLVEHRLAEDLRFFGLAGRSPLFDLTRREPSDAIDGPKPWALIMSFSTLAVRNIQRLLPNHLAVLLLNQTWSLGAALRVLKPDTCVGPHISLVTSGSKLIATFNSQFRNTFVWTVNSAPDLTLCFEQGASGVITDDALLALQIRAELSFV